jgi:hypothetical protein
VACEVRKGNVGICENELEKWHIRESAKKILRDGILTRKKLGR